MWPNGLTPLARFIFLEFFPDSLISLLSRRRVAGRVYAQLHPEDLESSEGG